MRTNLVQTYKTSANRINLNRTAMRVSLIGLFISLGIGNAWAGHGGACTAKLQVNKGTGSGTVYAATTESAKNGDPSVSANCGNSDSGKHEHTFYAFAIAGDGYTFLGWTESATSTAGADATNPKAVTIKSNNNATVTKTLYAHFVEKAQVNITFEAPSNGTYTIAVNGGSAETVSSADVVKSNVEGVVLTATPASGYAFAGWYKLNSAGEFVEDLSIANPYNASFATSETIKMGARFVPVTLGKFILKGSDTQYYGLKMATVAAGGSGTIVPVADETVVDGSDLMPFDNGTYSIKAGATLLVPYSSANTVQTAPQIITTAATLSAYKTLVFTDGVNVECDGTICAGGQIMAASGGNMSSYVSGPCGMINMANGGHIELNSGAKLYCWGFIKGQDMDQGNNTVGVGTITANSGAEVWENLGIGDWRGGSATSSIKNTRFFPFQSYFIQNIEVPLTIEYGAAEKNYIALNATGGPYSTSATTIGSSQALFLLNDANSTFRKWYDPTTDLTCFELSGTSQIDELAIKISALGFNINVNSSDFDLPINSSMHIILTNSSVNLSKPMVLQPGAVIEVKNDADIILSSNAYLYDKDNWGAYAGTDYYFHSYPNLTSHKNRGNGKSNDLLDDAKVIVDGTVSVTGKLYSTASGANVMGNGGGNIVFSSSLPTATTIPAFTGNGDAVSGGVAVNSANLCNEDESYTKAIASTTFYNVHGRWFKSGNQNENADHTYNFTYIASGAVSGTGGTDVSPNTHNAVYAPDKTGLIAGMKWCNVEQDVTCSNIFNATQALNEIPASDIRYTYPTDSWLQLLRTETEGVYGGSDNSLYAVDGCAVNSLGSVDENCLYTINDVKTALVDDGSFVALEKNTEDEAWHDVANPTNYYISFAGCTWHPATKYAGEEKAYIVEGGIYIWYNNDWLLVEREDPFFFDYNDQNVKRYYEYENGAWVLADPKVRITDAIETREFFFLPEAITVASGKKNATITILKDISGINSRMTYSASNTTCTLDLNGHTVRGAVPFTDDNNRGLLKINASGTTFTITDNSANKDGRLENICEQNKVTYAVHLMAGTLNVEHGTIHAENPAQYASKVSADLGVSAVLTGCGARGIQVNAAQTLNVTGGRIEAHATRNAYGIVASGNNANTTQVTITAGEIYAEAPCSAYGIYCSGKLNISGGLVEAKLNDHLVNASFVATDASNNINAHTTCYGIYMTGTANKAATSCYFGTLTMTGGKVKATSTVAASYTSNVYGINLYAEFAGTGNVNTKATDGTLSQKYAAKATIENAKIEVNTNANYGYGIVGYGRYNSADKSTSVIKVKNTKVAVYARTYAYGILSSCRISTGTGNGGCTNADIELTNCDVYAETTIGANAYAVWSSATQGAVYEYTYKDGVATATNSIYAGEYAIGANMTVHSGRYEAITKTSCAYASGTSPKQINTYSRHSGTALYQQLGGQVEAYSTLNIEDGTFIATAGTETARAVSNGGNTTITGGTFQATATTRYAYCIYAISGTLNVSNATITATSNSNTATGIHLEGTIDANTMFAYAPTATLTNLNVTATTGTGATACALYVKGTTKTQTEAQKEALTSSNRNNYYNIYQVGEKAIAPTVTVHGGTYTATAGTSSAYGAHSSKTSVSTNKVATASPVMNLYDATFTATTGTSTTAYGVQSGGPTLIEGCTIEATAGNATTYQSTASGVRALDKTTTIKNSTITATATDKAYGLEGCVEIDGTHGYCWHGEFNLSEAGNTEVTAEAKTKAKTSYAIYLNATKKAIASGNFAGDYATAANATINGGTYVAKFNTSGTAYVISLGAKQTQGSVVAQPEVEVLDGFFNGATAEVGTAGVVGHMQLKGGYFVHPANLATYAVAPKSVWTLPNTHEHYNPYKYKVTEHYTITFKNGTTQLQQNDLETGTTPTYSGTPTKDGKAQYTYTFDGWSTTDGGDKLAALPAVAGEATYYAHFSKTENKYTVSVAAGANGAVSPASVSGIGCETASGDITATPNVGYRFVNWTLPDGVTAANGYSATSNPIHIHATAADKTITANFVARNDIEYTVKHYQQNLGDNEYTLFDTQKLTGTTDTEVTPAVNNYTGFTAPATQTKTIAADGSMEIAYYYTRNTYTITWVDGNGTTIATDEAVKYGATPVYTGATPTKAEDENYTYTFNDTWSPAITSVTRDATYTAQFNAVSKETGFYVDIVDVNNSEKTLKLNVSGTEWVTAGWPYEVNGTVYYRDQAKATAAGSDKYRATDRTLTIPYTGEPGENFTVTIRNASSTLVSKHTYIIPQEIKSATTLTTDQTAPIFVKGATLTVDADKTIKNIYVAPGAKLVVNTGVTLKADTVFLRTTPWASAELDLNGTITGQVCYTRIILSKSGYFQFGLPLSCPISAVRLSNGKTVGYKSGTGWILRYYDEDKRATTGPGDNWATLDVAASIAAGRGYEMYSGVDYYREFYFPVDLSQMTNTVHVDYTAGEQPTNNGWNVLVSPLTHTFTNTPQPEGMKISWMQLDGSFLQEPLTTVAPAMTFAYQAVKAGSLVFDGSNVTVPTLAPRRVAAVEEATRIQWMHLDIKDANGLGDQTSIYSHPTRYDQTFKMGVDEEKQSLTASRALLYSSHAYGEMAFAGVADELLEQGVALTVYSPEAQELTISMRENEWLNRMASVWLIDKATGAQIDLLESDYSFSAEAGTTAGRFILMGAFFAPQITTDNGTVRGDEDIKAKKFIYKDKMYIQINGVIYDATGKLVK